MRRPDTLEWLLLAAMLLGVAALGQAILLAANGGLVHTLTATVTVSRSAPESTAAADTGPASAYAAVDDASTAMAADIAAEFERDATRLAVTIGALLVALVATVIVRARQLRRAPAAARLAALDAS